MNMAIAGDQFLLVPRKHFLNARKKYIFRDWVINMERFHTTLIRGFEPFIQISSSRAIFMRPPLNKTIQFLIKLFFRGGIREIRNSKFNGKRYVNFQRGEILPGHATCLSRAWIKET